MKMQVLAAATLLTATGSMAATETDFVQVSTDGRLEQSVGIPRVLLTRHPLATHPFDPVAVECKVFKMRAFIAEHGWRDRIPDVLYGAHLALAWHESERMTGRAADLLFYCVAPEGATIYGQSGAISARYQYRETPASRVHEGVGYTFIKANLLVGVVTWGVAAESTYVSKRFAPE